MKSRADHNQDEIVEGLKKLGCSVVKLTMVGGGCPDLLIGAHGRDYLIEIKAGGNRLNNDQKRFHALWRGQIAIAHDLSEAIKIIYPQPGKLV